MKIPFYKIALPSTLLAALRMFMIVNFLENIIEMNRSEWLSFLGVADSSATSIIDMLRLGPFLSILV